MRITLTLMLIGLLGGCEPVQHCQKRLPAAPPQCRQLIVVYSLDPVPCVVVHAWERTGDVWLSILSDLPGVVGRSGVAPIGQKHEGDGCTPAGVFAIGTAFGYAPMVNTRLAYRQTTPNDFWIDDPGSPMYNRWITSPSKPKCSHEEMRRTDDYYSLGAVIEYNTSAVVAGRGSAIFLHVWRGRNEPTTGCVALSAPNVAKLLAWLDKNKSPMIAILKNNNYDPF